MTHCILIVTNRASDAELLENIFKRADTGPFLLLRETSLQAAISRMQQGVDAVLADMELPDSKGFATFDTLFSQSSGIPILTFHPDDDEELGIEITKRGSFGYLLKKHMDCYVVPQTLHMAIKCHEMERSFNKEKSRTEITLNSINEAVLIVDRQERVDYLNFAAEKLTGWAGEEAIGQHVSAVMKIIDRHSGDTEQKNNEVVRQETSLQGGRFLVRRDGSEVAITESVTAIHDSNGTMEGQVIVFHDLTEAQSMTEKMIHLAQHDFLTNLPNRSLLNDRITQAIALAKRRETKLALLFLDLDNFKHINDSLGHETGDLLLKAVAETLSGCVRSSDTVSRQGGDEFVILVTQSSSDEDAALTAEKIISALAVSYSIGNHDLHVTTSIGISLYPEDGEDAETLIKNADTAMYYAKKKGRNNFQFFKNEMNVRAVERQVIETNLRYALQRHQFVLHYQPKINLESGAITGAEALLRWAHPVLGMVPPERFIPIAEDSGLIVPLGRWALREACMQARRWKIADLGPGSIAVNISALEFHQKDFIEAVRIILHETELDPSCLQLEITESALIPNAETSGCILKQLKNMGLQLAVDDFGTGYSSLSYLNQFPIDILKIDKLFVQDIGTSHGAGAIASAVIAMGNSLNQRVIAEGVEDMSQFDFLKAQRCEEGQGYLFSRPLGVELFTEFLKDGFNDFSSKALSHYPAS